LVVLKAVTAKDSRQKLQGFCSKSKRWLFVRRSPQKTHDRSGKDSQQKQALVVRQAITEKDSRKKRQGFAAKSSVGCSSGDHRKRLTREAARIRSKSNRS